MLRYTDDSRSRILDGLKKYIRVVAQARQRGMNERDTADIVKVMLGDVLGYDPFFDVTAEVSVRGPVADHAIMADGKLRFLLFVKSIGVIPNTGHLLRLSGASSPVYADWALLSNADVWACYRLGVGTDRHPELVFRVSLLDSTSLDEKANLFTLISKEGLIQDALTLFWEQTRVLHPGRIASLVLSPETLNLLRREIQRTANYRIDRHTLYEFLIREVLRPEALNGRVGEGEKAPKSPHCYAYVRNPNDAGTWRLQYRNEDGSANAEMLMQAVADLGGDVRLTGIPGDDVPLVKERLRKAYLELGVSAEDIPVILRRSERV